MIIVVYGVSGTGKSTIGKLLAQEMGWIFADADDFHPQSNIEKMSAGIPLGDDDRKPWLAILNGYCQQMADDDKSLVLACSALKESYRAQISAGLKDIKFAHLHDSYDLISQRMQARKNHFMSAQMLQSQFDTLEPCNQCHVFALQNKPVEITRSIMQRYNLIKPMQSEVLLKGLLFPESPRWHNKQFWFTDQHAQKIITTDMDGNILWEKETADLPGGLGWLPDGTMLVVYMKQRKVYQLSNNTLSLYADLSEYASFHCNDMVMDTRGNAWVGNFGYDLAAGEAIKPAEIIHINPQQQSQIAVKDIIFPNGCVLSQDEKTIIIAETFASRIRQFDINADGTLSNARIWADLDDAHPDGICWADNESLWVAAPNKGKVLKVAEGGQILAEIKTQVAPYACMTGGDNHDYLLITASATSDPEQAKQLKSGQIEICQLF